MPAIYMKNAEHGQIHVSMTHHMKKSEGSVRCVTICHKAMKALPVALSVLQSGFDVWAELSVSEQLYRTAHNY